MTHQFAGHHIIEVVETHLVLQSACVRESDSAAAGGGDTEQLITSGWAYIRRKRTGALRPLAHVLRKSDVACTSMAGVQ